MTRPCKHVCPRLAAVSRAQLSAFRPSQIRIVKIVSMLRQKRDGTMDAQQPSAVGKKLNDKIVQNVIISVSRPSHLRLGSERKRVWLLSE